MLNFFDNDDLISSHLFILKKLRFISLNFKTFLNFNFHNFLIKNQFLISQTIKFIYLKILNHAFN